MKILVINGPNLNMLGKRDPAIYSNGTYDDLLELIDNRALELNLDVDFFQSNHEGAIIDRIQEAMSDDTMGIIINPGAYAHYSYAIHDALEMVFLPKIEVHISDIRTREEFRHTSVTEKACDQVIIGEGFNGYVHALDLIVEMINE